jgi:hypothetical protein
MKLYTETYLDSVFFILPKVKFLSEFHGDFSALEQRTSAAYEECLKE